MASDTTDWTEYLAKRDRKMREVEAEIEGREAPLLEALGEVGVEVETVWELVNTSETYERAVPVLFEHLKRDYPDRIRDGIARALGVRAARHLRADLAEIYRQETGPETKDGLAVALSILCHRGVLEEMIELVSDRQHGPSRLLLLRGLTRLRDERAKRTLEQLADDPDLEKEIAVILKRRRKREGS